MGLERPKTHQKPRKMGYFGKIPLKTCGNRRFPIDFRFRKPHSNHRQGSSKPHEYRVFVHSLIKAISSPHAVRISRRKPVNTVSPRVG